MQNVRVRGRPIEGVGSMSGLDRSLACWDFFVISPRSLVAFPEIFGGYNEKRLLHKLLDHYNVLERPVVNESDPLQLSFGLTLMQIIDVVSNVIFTVK